MSSAATTLATGATPPAHRTLQRTTMTTPRRPGPRSRRALLAALLATLLSTIVLPALASAATGPIPRAAAPRRVSRTAPRSRRLPRRARRPPPRRRLPLRRRHGGQVVSPPAHHA